MSRSLSISLLVTVLTLGACSVSLAASDLQWEWVKTDKGSDQPQITKVYLKQDKVRMEVMTAPPRQPLPGMEQSDPAAGTAGQAPTGAEKKGPYSIAIIRLDRGLAYTLQPEQRTYSEKNLEAMRKIREMMRKKMEEKGPQRPEAQVTMKVEDGGTVLGYRCKKYTIEQISPTDPSQVTMHYEIWATDDLGPEPGKTWRAFQTATVPGGGPVFDKLNSIESLPLKSITKLNLGFAQEDSVMEVRDLKMTTIDDSLFELPEGYVPGPTGVKLVPKDQAGQVGRPKPQATPKPNF